MDKKNHSTGDMDPADFREAGHEIIDWIADYLENTSKYPVLSTIEPGVIKKSLPENPPEKGESFEEIFRDFENLILPGITHWNHPSFFSYFSITGSAPGILGELLCSALNVNAMLWKTSPSATELEELVLDWLRQMLGLPEEYWGIIYDTASVSTLHALVAARQAIPGYDIRRNGYPEEVNLRMYTSEQSHSSIEKAAMTIGIGQTGVRKIPVDEDFRMDVSALKQAVIEDRKAGWLPFCVVASVGTTSTTSVDPVSEISSFCIEEKIWLHVDAAYAGPTAILPEMKWVLEGCEKADSFVTNPHKWLFTPIDLSAFYCRHPEILKEAFSLVPEYLKTAEDGEVTNYMDYGIQLGRRFRALKLWMVIRHFGQEGIRERIRQHLKWAREFAGWIDNHSGFERMAPTPFSTLCFRAVADPGRKTALTADELNEQLLSAVNNSGEVFLSHTKLNGRYTLRLAIGNLKTKLEHLERCWEIIQEQTERLLSAGL